MNTCHSETLMDTEDVVPERIGNTGEALPPNMPACPYMQLLRNPKMYVSNLIRDFFFNIATRLKPLYLHIRGFHKDHH